jgi:hypothetical protein
MIRAESQRRNVVMRRLSTAILIATSVLIASAAQARESKILDAQKVESRVEQIVFRVGRGKGPVSQISFRATNEPMLLTAVEIVYGNGERQRVDFLARIRPGDESRPISLEGERRHVEQVIVWKRPAFRPWIVGELQLLGLAPDLGGPPGQFEIIDTQTVDTRADSVEFRVGGREGRFAAIQFRVAGETLLLNAVDIEFANRERQRLELFDRLLPGTGSRIIDIKGEARRIEKVTLWKRPTFRPGRVRVELLALEEPERGERGPSWSGIGPTIPRGWVLFGAQTVDFSADRDVITVGADVGRFERIALRVLDNDIFLREVTVVYANGERDRKVVETEIRANSQTRPIELKGDRFIRQIELLYRSRPDRRSPAVVEVYGDYAGDWLGEKGKVRDYQGGWLMLGAQRAAILAKDSDVIQVGERFGRFKAVRLAAKREDVRIYSARVVYGNGETEDLPVSGTLKSGQSTQPIDLKGRGRFIERVELKYRSKLTLKGQGIIELWGLS